jgi:tRNA (guanine37-N1)-methyltransferase
MCLILQFCGMKIQYITMFPENFDSFRHSVLMERAERKGILTTAITDIRDFADGSYRHIDDSVCGGGAGMILKCEPVIKAIRSVRTAESHVVLLDPAGAVYDQKKAHALASYDDLVFVCGHYEGFDARIYDEADEMISLGDFILSGGEWAAIVISDSIVRLKEGILKDASTAEESFETPRLEYAQYTRPLDFEGKKVPDVLLSGNHEKIRQWRVLSALLRTMKYRPDLLEEHPMNEEEKKLYETYKEKKR